MITLRSLVNAEPFLENPAEFLQASIIGSYVDVAAATMFFYDYLITLPLEIEFIWKGPWTRVTYLWFATRYLVVFDGVVFPLINDLARSPSVLTCLIIWYFETWGHYVGLIVGEVLLIIRTVAIWGGDKRVVYGLSLLLFAVAIPAAYSGVESLLQLQFAPSPSFANLGCLVTNLGEVGFLAYAVLMLFETILLIVTLSRAAHQRDLRHTNLFYTIIRDGFLYYIFLFTISVINIITLVALPAISSTDLVLIHRVLHSILTTRLILNIRKAVRDGKDYYSTIRLAPAAADHEEYQMHPLRLGRPNRLENRIPLLPHNDESVSDPSHSRNASQPLIY